MLKILSIHPNHKFEIIELKNSSQFLQKKLVQVNETMKLSYTFITLAFLVFSSLSLQSSFDRTDVTAIDLTTETENKNVTANINAQLTATAPFTLSGNAAFASCGCVSSGDGSESSPYILKNLNITSSSPTSLVLIENSEVFFELRDSL